MYDGKQDDTHRGTSEYSVELATRHMNHLTING